MATAQSSMTLSPTPVTLRDSTKDNQAITAAQEHRGGLQEGLWGGNEAG